MAEKEKLGKPAVIDGAVVTNYMHSVNYNECVEVILQEEGDGSAEEVKPAKRLRKKQKDFSLLWTEFE